MLLSFEGTIFRFFLFLNALTKFYDFIKESLFSAIFCAICIALGRPIKDLACPAEIFSLSTYEITSFGRPNNLKEFAI